MKVLIRFSFLWFILVYMLVAALAGGNHSIAFPITTIGYTAISIFWFRNTDKQLKTGVLHLGLSFAALMIILILFFNSFEEIAAGYALVSIISVIVGYYYSKKNIVWPSLLLTLPLIYFFVAVPNLRLFLNNKDAQAVQKMSEELSFYSYNKELIDISDAEWVVLDFWHTRCGICFRSFPEFENLKSQFSQHSEIQFFSVNVPLPREVPDSSLHLFKSLGYEVEPLYVPSKSKAQELFNFNSYPHYVILHQGEIKFSGKFDWSPVILSNKPEDILNELMEKTGA